MEYFFLNSSELTKSRLTLSKVVEELISISPEEQTPTLRDESHSDTEIVLLRACAHIAFNNSGLPQNRAGVTTGEKTLESAGW